MLIFEARALHTNVFDPRCNQRPARSLSIASIETRSLLPLERAAVAIGMQDPSSWRLDRGVLQRWLGFIIGSRVRNQLADPHLETLRVLAIGLRARKNADVVAAICTAQAIGMTDTVIDLVKVLVLPATQRK
jgi:hypothetical protein